MIKKLHLVCNAHLDPVWQWEWEEGAAAALSTFASAVNLAEEFDYIFLGDLRSCSLIHPANIFDDLVLNDFEDTKFYIFKQSDKLLRTVYGNYMEFPPKEKQKWTHSPIEVSFGDT